LSAGANVISGVLGYKAQKDTNETNINLGREQMAFQERMSGSAYQRGVEDMKKSGLNPMLAYSQGGASSPMGSMPQIQNAVGAGMSTAAQSSQVMQGIAQMVSTLAQTEKTSAEAEQIRRSTLPAELYGFQGWSNLHQSHEQTRKLMTGANLDEANAEVASVLKRLREIDERREAGSWAADVRKRKAQASLTELEIPRSKSEAQFYESLGQANPWVRMFLEIMKGLRGSGVK